MGSNETATATTGGPQKLAFLTGARHHRVQIIYFFRMQIGSQTPSGIGLGSDSRLRRMRRCLGLPMLLLIENFGKSWAGACLGKGPWEMYLEHAEAAA